MSSPDSGSSEELVAIAKTARPRGLRGELVADLLTDFPERFEGLDHVVGIGPKGERLPLELENHWFQDNRVVLKFAGYDSIERAGELVGFEITVPLDERVELDEDEFFEWELEGCTVLDPSGKEIGHVRGVMKTGGVPLLVVYGSNREMLIPMAEDICVEIDVKNSVIRVDPPEGLLDM